MNVLSYHLCIETDHNRVFSGDSPAAADIEAIKKADAVILPQGCKEILYRTACRHCAHVFPDYSVCYAYPVKTGQHALFKEMGVPHPLTISYQDISQFTDFPDSFLFPFVFKFSWGGEGTNVFLVRSEEDLRQCLARARKWEKQNKKGFILQEYVPTNGRSLRVVVIGNTFYSYWRQSTDAGFYTNLAKGAVVDRHSCPELQEKAVVMLKDFCPKTGINLAGFDFLFPATQKNPDPLFLEINFCFRCKGLGGVDRYHQLLEEGIRQWLSDLA